MTDNFNYIAFGNRDIIRESNKPISMNRGRMFEYTPSELTHALENLKTESIQFLKKLPTFLCSEISDSENGKSILVKYGKIKDTSINSSEVTTNFETQVDFGEVIFKNLEHAKKVFGAGDFQLYRTHWAVKTGDVKIILDALRKLKPIADNELTVLNKTSKADAAKLPHYEKQYYDKAASLSTFLKILEKWSAGENENVETFFRGHEDPTFQLTPSLLRKSEDGAWQFLTDEDRLCKDMLIAHYDEFQDDQYCFDHLVRMQHYGLPTRLLDISSNPLVALFFACFNGPKSDSKSGEVILFRIPSKDIKYYDSDTVSCISNLSKLSYLQKNKIDLKQDREDFNNTEVAKKLLHHIKEEKAFFEPNIKPCDLGSIICVKAKRTNIRIKSQMGAFLIFGHEIMLQEEGQPGIGIARIQVTNKPKILKQLDAININASTVYPSISETAAHLKTQRN